ncbi:hypothetical protein [Thermoflexibacter ruber]|uniref:Natural product n=1 Tax=Thermoflexibacter ruber TaxID=1003 RepID=A0A1I2K220_9BACT|nr:hypothetical protein [Thermoflexibacter ruber]SFF59257.1 natural product precursor [Thermoflexibacter ruber]
MKTLKEKFAQFEMTKEQMKQVKGGANWICRNEDTGQDELYFNYDSPQEIALDTGFRNGTCEQL